jgi:hypothetical protein
VAKIKRPGRSRPAKKKKNLRHAKRQVVRAKTLPKSIFDPSNSELLKQAEGLEQSRLLSQYLRTTQIKSTSGNLVRNPLQLGAPVAKKIRQRAGFPAPPSGHGPPPPPPPPAPDPCAAASQISFPYYYTDFTWMTWGIIDDNDVLPQNGFFFKKVFQPTNQYELATAIQLTEADGMTLRALGSGWSFSEATLPQPKPFSFGVPPSNPFDAILNQFGYAVDTSGLDASLQAYLPAILADGVDPSELFFVEAGIKLHNLNSLLDCQVPPVSLATMGGSAGQSLAGAFSTGTHGGDFDRPPLADSVRAIYLISAGGQHYWIERSAPITDPIKLNAQFPCLPVDRAYIIQDDDTFYSTLVSMGSMGVIYAVVLDVVPQYKLIQWTKWTTWEALVQERTQSLDLESLFTGEFTGLENFLNNDWPADLPGGVPKNRYVEILVNPIRNDDGTHNCFITNRAQIPPIKLSLPGMQVPGAPVDPIAAILNSSEFQSMLDDAKNAGVDIGAALGGAGAAGLLGMILGGDIVGALGTLAGAIGTAFLSIFGIGAGTIPMVVATLQQLLTVLGEIGSGIQAGNLSQIQQAQMLVSACEELGIVWPARVVIDAFMKSKMPLQTGGGNVPYVDIGYKVMAGAGVFSNDLQGSIASSEGMFPFTVDKSVHEVDAVEFMTLMLLHRDRDLEHNIITPGYFSLRACGPTSAYLGTERFGEVGGQRLSNVTGTIEFAVLENSNSVNFTMDFENSTQIVGGFLHWGQSCGLATNVAASFPQAATWKKIQTGFGLNNLGYNTFLNNFMVRTGLSDPAP